MPLYDYRCQVCSTDKEPFTWVVQHGMDEKPIVTCPQCGGKDTEKTFTTVTEGWIRGYGWLDKSGRQRDMHLHKLMNDDPYRHMRQPGEKDELAASLRKGGKHNKNPKTFYMDNNK
jgi:putative FmdB family regulatory protein